MALRERLTLPDLSRRQVLAGAAVGGGLLLAWNLWPRNYEAPLVPGDGEHAFGAWLTVAEDGVVTVAVPQLEMGQGVSTLLPQIVAQEMGASWQQVALAPVPPSGAQANIPLAAKWAPLWASFPSLADEPDAYLAERFARGEDFCVTAEGSSLAAFEQDCREAGASARAMLAMAAAELWDVSWEACEVADGFVSHGERRARFGELAALAATMEPPDLPPLRPEPYAEQPIAGEAEADGRFPRLDLPAKVDGSLLFAADVRLPGMVHASIRHGVHGRAELVGFGEGAAARADVIAFVKAKRWIAAVAENWWQADRALEAIRPRFDGPGAVDSGQIADTLDAVLKDGGRQRVAEVGSPDDIVGLFDFTARYDIAPAVHASIETASATARYADGKLELWIASQAPGAARRAAAKAIGISERDVVLYPMAAGGSFDARLEKQHAIEVAQIAYETGRPVQLTWPRGEELKVLPVRTPAAIDLDAWFTVGEIRRPMAMRARYAMPATMREFGHRLFDNATPEAAIRDAAGFADPLALEGAVPPYRIPHLSVDHVPVTLALATGRLRGNAAALTGFANECFIDELAEQAGSDPYLYRLNLLRDHPRAAEVLRRATELGEWDGGREGSGQGLALIRMTFGEAEGTIACVARSNLRDGVMKVSRMVAVCDIGRIANLDIARQQIEGGLLFGLAQARGSSIGFAEGRPIPASLSGLGLPTLPDTPEITVDFVASDAPPFDPGELGAAVAPPAIANGLYSATGVRYRRLPMLTERL